MSGQANPIANLMALLGSGNSQPQQNSPGWSIGPQGTSPAPPQAGAASAIPQSAPAPPQGMQGMSPMIQSLMGQAQQTMNNSMGQSVPQMGGGIDALKHPLIAGLMKILASAATGFGQTAMMPEQRLQAQQLNQQKGEALSRLAETGAYEQGNLGIRQENVGINQQKANTGQENADTNARKVDIYDRVAQERNQIASTRNDITLKLGQGRIAEAADALAEKADDFSRKLNQDRDIAANSLGVRSQANDIRQGYVDMLGQVRQAGVQQKNAEIVQKADEALGKLQSTNWLQELTGMQGPATAAQGVQGLGGVPQPLPQMPQTSTAPTNKAQAKGAPKSSAGVTHIYNPATGRIEPANAGQ